MPKRHLYYNLEELSASALHCLIDDHPDVSGQHPFDTALTEERIVYTMLFLTTQSTRLHGELLVTEADCQTSYYPDLIKGDLDSLRDDVAAYFREKAGMPIIKDDDQYATDLDKCIKSLEELEARTGDTHQLVIYGGLSGRFDQTIHTVHKLCKLRKRRKYSWVVSEESLTCLLDVGSHKLYQPKHLLGPTCGILPIGIDSAQVTTTGLEWNLDNTETSMDTMVSSSNHLTEEIVTVITDKPVVWTAELRRAQ